ncbi:MAG: hypothetical protein J5802_01035 [Butyrivibrio sp.]|nr:hypothetical protein [Butyrivibrio sp.]
MKRRLIAVGAFVTIASFCIGCASEKELNVDNVERKPIVEDKTVIVDENGNIIHIEDEEEDNREEVDTAASTGAYDVISDDLEAVFEKFEGSWIFDAACESVVMVEKASDSACALPNSTWMVSISGGDSMSDLDVMDYSKSSIYFFKKNDDGRHYYKLSFNPNGEGVEMACGQTRDMSDNVIICDGRSEE